MTTRMALGDSGGVVRLELGGKRMCKKIVVGAFYVRLRGIIKN
jgi:hypothetical protein